jgi:hypothetical protein
MKFTEYLTEAKEGKNVHLEHIEDEVLNRGVVGTRESINFLQSLRNMLAGNSDSKVNVTTKWDGAPAVFCGTNPENGKFFVGTKSVFNKNAKCELKPKVHILCLKSLMCEMTVFQFQLFGRISALIK